MEDRLRRAYYRRLKRPGFRKNGMKLVIAVMLLLLAFVVIALASIRKQQEESRKTIGSLLVTALQPVGNTMYIWGGGWSDEDTGSGAGSTRIGVSPRWAEFAAEQDKNYDFDTTRFQRQDGLDCSGYIGWCVYNVMESRSGKEGYVVKATCMALNYAKRGWGTFSEAGKASAFIAGDIMSMDGHVWMVVGSCKDGSVVLLHSTPPGVGLAGTLLADGSKSEAVVLAEEYMRTYYPDWYERYPKCEQPYSYLTDSASMSWGRKTLSDKEGLTGMPAAEVLDWMFSNR